MIHLQLSVEKDVYRFGLTVMSNGHFSRMLNLMLNDDKISVTIFEDEVIITGGEFDG